MSYIGIEGSIASGKSTLARALSDQLGWQWLPEPVDDNICLEDFYADPKRWAFATQMYFLYVRTRMHMHAAYSNQPMILDRTLPGDRAFAHLHYRYGNLHELEWKIYNHTFSVARTVYAPSLMVYLEVDPETAFARLKKRARGVESGVTLQYLKDLDTEYEDLIRDIESGTHQWSRGMKVLRVPWNLDVDDVRKSPSYEVIVETAKKFCRL